MRMLILFISLILLCLIITFFYVSSSHQLGLLGFADTGAAAPISIARITFTVFGLLAGILCGAVHRLWRKRSDPITLHSVGTALRSPDLWRSLLASPLVFSGVYAVANTQPDVLLALLSAFQSGFLCDSIVQKRLKEAPDLYN